MTTRYQYDLKAFRDRLQWSQEAAAGVLHVSVRTWSRNEAKGSVPPLWYWALQGIIAYNGGEKP